MKRRSWRKLSLGGLASTLTVMALGGCGPDFEPYWRVDKLRILAMKADPVTLRPNNSATLDVLAYIPSGEDVTYRWEWCPFQTAASNSYECPISREDLVAQLREGIPPEEIPEGVDVDQLLDLLIPQFELGEEPTATFPYPGSPDFILGICESLQASLAGEDNELSGDAAISSECERGYEATFRVIITDESGQEFVGAKRILLWTGSEEEDNINPDVTGIEIRLEDPDDLSKVSDKLDWIAASEASEERWHLMPEDAPLELVAGIPFEIRSRVDEESIQTFRKPAPMGSDEEYLEPELEALVFRWFVGGGDLGDARSIFAEEFNTLDDASNTTLNFTYDPAPELTRQENKDREDDWDLDGVENGDDNCPYVKNPDQLDEDGDALGDRCTVSIWSVTRDGRLGIDWIERRVKLIDFVE